MRRRLARKLMRFLCDRTSLEHWLDPLAAAIPRLLHSQYRHHYVVPLRWIDQSCPKAEGTLQEQTHEHVFTPTWETEPPPPPVHRLAPPLRWRHFQSARVHADTSAVLLANDALYLERAGRSDTADINLASGFLVNHCRTRAVVRNTPPQHIENGIFLGGNGSSNYYHWLIELLPKCEYIKQLPDQYGSYNVLVSESVRRIPSFGQALSRAASKHKVTILERDKVYLVDNLIYIDNAVDVPFNLTGRTDVRPDEFYFRKTAIEYLRRLFLTPEITRDTVPSNEKFGKKVFLARDPARRPYNQDEVAAMLSRHGFVSVRTEQLSFEEQVKLFYDAEWIVGPTGASWANLAFAKPGVKCICWMPEEAGDFPVFSTIGQTVGAELRYMRCKTGAKSTADLYLMRHQVDIRALENIITSMES